MPVRRDQLRQHSAGCRIKAKGWHRRNRNGLARFVVRVEVCFAATGVLAAAQPSTRTSSAPWSTGARRSDLGHESFRTSFGAGAQPIATVRRLRWAARNGDSGHNDDALCASGVACVQPAWDDVYTGAASTNRCGAPHGCEDIVRDYQRRVCVFDSVGVVLPACAIANFAVNAIYERRRSGSSRPASGRAQPPALVTTVERRVRRGTRLLTRELSAVRVAAADDLRSAQTRSATVARAAVDRDQARGCSIDRVDPTMGTIDGA